MPARHLGGGSRRPSRNDGRAKSLQHRFDDSARPPAGGRRKRGTREQAFGRSRGGFSCKVHCLCDSRGRPLAFHLTGGEVHDSKGYPFLIDLAPAAPKALIADKGYDSAAIRADLKARKIKAVIPPRHGHRKPPRWDKRLYRQRSGIECMIGHLKANRAIATRYDKLAESFLGMLDLAAAKYWLKFVHRA